MTRSSLSSTYTSAVNVLRERGVGVVRAQSRSWTVRYLLVNHVCCVGNLNVHFIAEIVSQAVLQETREDLSVEVVTASSQQY